MYNQVAIIANKYSSAINRIFPDATVRIDGYFDKYAFENETNAIAKMQYLDLVIIDVSALNGNIAEMIGWLKTTIVSTARIIVLYPNLGKDPIYYQLIAYAIYDIVRPTVDESVSDDITIENIICNELQWALSEPVTFSKVAQDLSVTVITNANVENIPEEVAAKPDIKEKVKNPFIKKPRVIGFYGDNITLFDMFKANSKYTVAGIYAATEEEIGNHDLSTYDIVVFADAPTDMVAYAKSLVDVNTKKAVIVAGYSNPEEARMAESIKGINVFEAKDPKEFLRQVSINSVKKADASQYFSFCTVYGIYGVKGGVGSTSLTAIMAKDYVKEKPGSKVLAIDFSTKAGDLGIKFGLEKPDPNLFECVASFAKAKNEHLDIETLKDKVLNYCHYTSSKVFVLPTAFSDIYRYTNYQYTTEDLVYIYEFILKRFSAYFDAIFIDITKFGGYPYELALNIIDKLILVSDAKLPSVYQLQIKLDELKEKDYLKDVYVIINRSNVRKNENECDNVASIEGKVAKDRIIHLPVDDYLLNEKKEMETVYGAKFKKALKKMWATIENLAR